MKKSARRLALLSATVLSGLTPLAAYAADDAAPADAPIGGAEAGNGQTIFVTATRRTVSLQDVPINITAASQATLDEQRIDTVRDLAAFTPGLSIADTGTNGATIVMRGLTTADANGAAANDSDSEAIYFGETPMYIDLKFMDINRVETLLGPQGTLYGLGTMFGAIRYIPNRPNANEWEGNVHGRGFVQSHSNDPGVNADATINIPLVRDVLAFRGSVGYWNNPGFIDYTALVNQPGVSNPQPGGLLGNPADQEGSLNYYINSRGVLRFERDIIGVNPATGEPNAAWYGSLGTPEQIAANLHTKKDANYETTLSTRSQIGFYPTDWLRIYGSWMHQETDSGAAQANSGGAFGTGKYVSTKRFLNPSHRVADLYSIELEADILEIAQLVSDTAWTKQTQSQSADNTDLLLDLNYDYELFPNFASFNERDSKRTSFNQELRLVSKHPGPVSWVLGAFYNKDKFESQYHEETPGFNAWAQANVPGVYGVRDDDWEYASISNTRKIEKAVYGEATLNITDAWQVTGGGRYYKYSISTQGGSTLPFFDGPFVGDPDYAPGVVNIPVNDSFASKSGFVWKGNTSYKFSPDFMVYLTVSKGYRLGGANTGAVPCTDAILNGSGQKLCLLPNEQFYGPDTTLNKELGIRFGLFGDNLRGTLAVFHVDWDGIQVPGAAVNGAAGITVNGSKAVSKGVELSLVARPTYGLTINGSYSYTDAHITADIPNLLAYGPGGTAKESALAGDRLAGSPRHQGALGVTYELPVGSDAVLMNWTATYRGNVYSRIGLRGYGEKLEGYMTHRAFIGYEFKDQGFDVKLYADNIFDKFAVTGVGNERSRRLINDGIVSRYYQNFVLTPRRVGIEFNKRF